MRSLDRLTLAALLPSALAGLSGCSAELSSESDSNVNPIDDTDDSVVGDDQGTGDPVEAETVREVCSESKAGPRLLRRLTKDEANATFRTIFPEIASELTDNFSLDPESDLGFTTSASLLVVGGGTVRELLESAEEIAGKLTDDAMLPTILPCASASPDAACTTEFVNRYGRRLFRRPLTTDETSRYVSHAESVTSRSDFPTGLKWALVGMIESPHAIYRRELGESTDNGYALSQYELATNLAYTYSGTTPSEALLEKAANDALSTPEALREEAAALLDASEGQGATAEAFFREWLEYDAVAGLVRDGEPGFETTVSLEMVEETRAFVQELVSSGGTIRDLMSANYTFLTPELSTFYGYGDVQGGATRVERPPEYGSGILSQGSLLTRTAHQMATSPTFRGLLVYRNFLCNSRPEPPVVPPLDRSNADASTTRQLYEKLHAVGSCASCHSLFDPFGFAFESFDQTGRPRDTENGFPIDTTATITLPDGVKMDIDGAEDLVNVLDESDHIENCVSGLMAAYFLSEAGGANCLAEESRAEFATGAKSFRDLLLDLALAPHFSRRE